MSSGIHCDVECRVAVRLGHHAILAEYVLDHAVVDSQVSQPAAGLAVRQVQEDLELSVQAEDMVVRHLNTELHIFIDLGHESAGSTPVKLPPL